MKLGQKEGRYCRGLALACWFGLAGINGAHGQEVIPDYYNEPGLNPNRQYINQALHEHIDPFTGALQLHYVDIHLPGNGKFDLQVVRSYNSSAVTPLGSTPPTDYYPAGLGWTMHFGRVLAKTNTLPCAGTPVFDTRSNPVLELPDGSRQLLAYTATGSPLMLTTKRWRADCATTNSTQGFVVYSPEGTRYEMTRYMASVTGPSPSPLAAWYTTKIVDKNGNTATITYASGTGPAEIQSVTTSDGRSIAFAYSGGLIRQITGAPGQTYQYNYTAAVGSQYQLTSVTRPDGTQWQYSYNGPVANASGGGSFALSSLTYPQGGIISYLYDKVLFNSLATTYTSVVASRRILGDTWTYGYTPGAPGQLDTTVVTGPEGTTTYKHIGVNCTAPNSQCGSTNGDVDVFLYAVGALASKEIGSVQVEYYGYTGQDISPQLYVVPGLWGTWGVTNVTAPILTTKSIGRDSTAYNTFYSDFDSYGNPGRVIEEGPYAASPGRITDYTYYIDTGKWIVHQVKDVAVTGIDNTVSLTTRGFDTNGNMTSIVRDGVATTYAYDSQGNVSTATLPGGRNHNYSSYYRGIPRVEAQPEGISITRTVSDAGNLTTETNGNGYTTSYGYDGLDRLTSITYPVGSAVSIVYGLNTKSASRGALTESTIYDGFARPISITLGGINHAYQYDPLGRMTFASDPNSTSGTSFKYDMLNRVTQVKNQDGSSRATVFGIGTRTVTDERGRATVYYSRGYGDPDKTHLMAIAPAEPNTQLVMTRNGRDQVTSVSQGAYNAVLTRSFSYDGRGYLIAATNPETGVTTFGRDAAGNMTSRQIGTSGTTTYAYDGQNRLTGVTYPGTTPAVTKTYTKTNKLLSVSSSAANRGYSYDPNGNLTSETLAVGGQTFTTGYGYDGLDHLASITYPVSANVVTYAPDPLGRPTRASSYVTGVAYWPSGQVKDISYGNGTVTTYGQNQRLWPSGLTTRNGGGTAYLNSSYGYDAAGNLASVTDAVDSSYDRTLTYDGINRLIAATGPWGNGQVAYDGAGNIGLQTFGPATAAIGYGYDSNNRLTQLDGSLATTFTYDAYGNVATGYGNTYRYDDAVNLTCVNCADPANIVSFTYDGLNQRTSVTKGGVTTYELYGSNGHLLAEYTPSLGGKLVESVYLGARRVAQRRTGGTLMTNGLVTLTVSPTTVLVGQSATFTAAVTGNQPTGIVTFKRGPTIIGTAFLSGGQATLSAVQYDIGTHTITAVYGGDINNTGGEATTSFTVGSIIRNLTYIVASMPTVYPGDTATLTVTLGNGFNDPSGWVTFTENANRLAVVPMVSGVARVDLQVSAGSHQIVVEYSGDSFNYPASSTIVVTTAVPTFRLRGPTRPVAVGQHVPLGSELAAVVDCAGTVTFTEGSQTLGVTDNCQWGGLVSSYLTQVVASFATPGIHQVTATFRNLDGTLVVPATTSVTVQPANAPAEFAFVTDVKFDHSGNLYVADKGRIRKITPGGDIVSVAGGPPPGSILTTGNGVGVSVGASTLAIDSSGNVFAYSGARITKVTPDGDVTLFYDASNDGNDNGGGAGGCGADWGGMAFDNAGNLFVSNPCTHTIRKITPDGTNSIFAGALGAAGSTDGTGTAARFQWPTGLAFDSGGNLFVADYYDATIRKITPGGVVTTFAGKAGQRKMTNGTGTAARFAAPYALAFDNQGNLLVSENSNEPYQAYWSGNYDVRKIAPAGVVTTVAGLVPGPYDASGVHLSADGLGIYAQFSYPAGIATDAAGNVFVADFYSIRRVTSAGVVTTVAGRQLPDSFDGVHGADGRINDTTLVVSPSLPAPGQAVTMVASVTGNNPTGTVTFHDGTTALGTAPLSSGQATFTTTSLPGGIRTLTATYNGDANNPSSTSTNTDLEVGRTTMTITISPSPAVLGQSATITATISGGNPTGPVDFTGPCGGMGAAPLIAGKAQLVLADIGNCFYLDTGASSQAFTFSAYYAGDGNYQPSDANGTVTVYASRANSTTTLTVSPSPATYGGTVTLTATVTGMTPTGAVAFIDGATTLGTATLSSGKATLTTTALTAGSHSLTAVYAGNAANNGSTSAAKALTVNKAATTTTLAASPSPATYGGTVTLTATLTGKSPTGTVTFKDGTTTLGTASVTSGTATFTTSSLAVGSHSLTAAYAGDGNNNASTSAAKSLTVNKATTTTTLAVSPNPVPYGSTATLTATVTGSGSTGTVTFKKGTTTLGTGTLSAGKATYTTATLAKGSHSLTASYGGDGKNNGSTSPAVSLTVQ